MIRKTVSCAAIIGLVTVSLVAQGVLAQLGQTEARTREYALGLFASQSVSNSSLDDEPVILDARRGFLKLPPAARAAAMTGLYGWMKGYVASAEFKAAYKKLRDEQKPPVREDRGSVDDELRKKLGEQKAEAAQSAREMAGTIGKAKADEFLKSALAQIENPMMVKAMRMDIEETRERVSKDDAFAMKDWQQRYPPDPMTVVAAQLRAFVDATADVDFGAKRHNVQGEGGTVLMFENAAYQARPWQWRFSYEFGPEAIGAARAAAQAWLKELRLP